MTEAPSPVHEDDEQSLVQIVSGAVSALTFLVGFGLMFAGAPYFWVAFPVGFAGVLPVAIGLAKRYERSSARERGRESVNETADALEQLRNRYARGELTEAEFERRVERLLETESVADARSYVDRSGPDQRAGDSGPDQRASTSSRYRERERE